MSAPRHIDVHQGDYLRAVVSGRRYRVGAIDLAGEHGRAVMVSEPPCRTFAVSLVELAADIDAGRVVVERCLCCEREAHSEASR